MYIAETKFLENECPVWCDGHNPGDFPGQAHMSRLALLAPGIDGRRLVLRRKIIWLSPGKQLIVRFDVVDQTLQIEIDPDEELSDFWARAWALEDEANNLVAEYQAQVWQWEELK